MKFLKNFLVNLVLLALIFVVLYFIAPDLMHGVFQLYGTILGPGLLLFLLVVSALPRERRGLRR